MLPPITTRPLASGYALSVDFPFPLMLDLQDVVIPRATAQLLRLLRPAECSLDVRDVLRAAFLARGQFSAIPGDVLLCDDCVKMIQPQSPAAGDLVEAVRDAVLQIVVGRPVQPWRELLHSQWSIAAAELGARLDCESSTLSFHLPGFDARVCVRRRGIEFSTVASVMPAAPVEPAARMNVNAESGAIEHERSGLILDAEALEELVTSALACTRTVSPPYR